MKSAAIIGAGITGLTAAFYLKRRGIPVTVFESGGRAGGVIQSSRQDGFLAEFGPNTILETSSIVRQLVEDAGLASRRVYTDPGANARYIVRDRRPVAMPGSPLGVLTSPLFSRAEKLALLREPFIPARRDGVDESVAEFVRRRLNQQILDHAIDPMVAGIYAGDPHRLSVAHAFPRLQALEAEHGSLIKGQLFGARRRRERGELSKERAPKFSFDDGLQVLTDALAAELGSAVQLNTPVSCVQQSAGVWKVTTSSGESEHNAVVFCGTAKRLAELRLEVTSRAAGVLQDPPHALDLSTFSAIRYPPVASVVLGFRRGDVSHSCNGFGMLIPKVEGFRILGTIFSSALFPNRAPAGHVLLTSYVGGERNPELALLPPEKLIDLVSEDLRLLLGVRGQPVFQNVAVYPHAIPQYNVGYGVFKELMTDIERKADGFYLAGHFRDGVSLSDSIVSGFNVAAKVHAFISKATG